MQIFSENGRFCGLPSKKYELYYIKAIMANLSNFYDKKQSFMKLEQILNANGILGKITKMKNSFYRILCKFFQILKDF